MRFIDLSQDGGCSKKAPALQLKGLLKAVASQNAGLGMESLSTEFPDTGAYQLNQETLLSTVDVVLPMTINPHDFGRVTVLHTFSDLYASGGIPRFALCYLGLPSGMMADAPEAVMALSGAVKELSAEGAVLLGGHTVINQADFSLGFAAFGIGLPNSSLRLRQAKPGDKLIITKPLGSGIAVSRWKNSPESETDHDDVLEGMLLSNRRAAELISRFSVTSCTDVTGYGLLGHLYNIMLASEVSCRLTASRLPLYPSVSKLADIGMSTQGEHNIEYVLQNLKITSKMNPVRECAFFDSEVSGGLLFSVSPDQASEIIPELAQLGYSPQIIGEVRSGSPGVIEVVE